MKRVISEVLFVCLVVTCAYLTRAQDPSPWIEVSPGDDLFRVSMPREPDQEYQTNKYGDLAVKGKRYTAIANGSNYTFWSLENLDYRPAPPSDADAYLDACADLVWESLLKPAKDNLQKDGRSHASITYVKELSAKPLLGREYSLTLGEVTGTLHFNVADARIYVLLAMDMPGGVWNRERFFQSFGLKTEIPAPAQMNGGQVSTGEQPEDPNPEPVFAPRDLAEKAHILTKREPTYTESARKYGVQGTVVLRAVLSKDGQVTNIQVVRKLPHGLTQAAILAARNIEFKPAAKDGNPVSQYIQLEYNFNLY